MNFENLGLSPKVLSAIETAGYAEPTPIQAKAVPFVIKGRDVLGIAQTGTGKTASFVWPMLTRLEKGRARARMPRSLILAPTRELAAQVSENFETYGINHKLTVALLIGGVSFAEQDRKIDRGADVVIATPGRLMDHMERGKLLLNAIEILVIDEADRMLDMGFIPDIEKICKQLPFTRQTLFFSATMPPEIQRLVKNFLHTPERVEVAPQSTTASNIKQQFQFVSDEPRQKRDELRQILRGHDITNAIIFCNRKRDVGTLLSSLLKHGFNAGALHGDMDQFQRTKTLDAFRNGEITILAASDVAARGLDIPAVSHIFNYDVPIVAEDYVHRIGRTGRAGRDGYAATLVTVDDLDRLKAVETLRNEKSEWVGDTPTDEDFENARKSGRRGRRGGRPQGRARKPGTGSRSPARPATAKSSDRKKPPARPQSDRRSKGLGRTGSSRRRGGKPENTPVGMGDHVPDFMKKPT